MQSTARQLSFDELGEPLRDATFVVVDLETTGGSSEHDHITEIGAVKVRGGEKIGEFQTLVNPQAAIEPFVQVLTGITDGMVVDAPTIDTVLPMFLDFALADPSTILVAHNARFDVGFLRKAADELQISWPRHRIVDTVTVARRVLTRDEVPNCKLETLAMYLGARTRPTHRALDDARATVDVLHGLFERLGSLGVHSVEELLALPREVTHEQRRKRSLARDLPATPGVYVFRDRHDNPLYVGKSTNIQRRVRSYFTASEPRKRMREMVAVSERVDAIECAHDLEALVRENRLIRSLQPRYNRRSKTPAAPTWVKLTNERFPRLSIVHAHRDDAADYLGPFASRHQAESAIAAVHEALPIRRCTDRLGLKHTVTPCVLGQIGRCAAPCDHQITEEQYDAVIAPLRVAIHADPASLVEPVLTRIDRLAAQHRYEDAATLRDRAVTLLRALLRTQRIAALRAIRRAAFASSNPDGSWDLVVIRDGRLAAAARSPNTAAVLPLVRSMAATEQVFLPEADQPGPHGYEETEILAGWLERPGVRLVELEGEFCSPVATAARWAPWVRQRDVSRRPNFAMR